MWAMETKTWTIAPTNEKYRWSQAKSHSWICLVLFHRLISHRRLVPNSKLRTGRTISEINILILLSFSSTRSWLLSVSVRLAAMATTRFCTGAPCSMIRSLSFYSKSTLNTSKNSHLSIESISLTVLTQSSNSMRDCSSWRWAINISKIGHISRRRS